MKKSLLIFIFSQLIIQHIIAQTDTLKTCCIYKMIIVADSTNLPLSNVHIYNNSSASGTVSNLTGSFNLLVKNLDTVSISRIGFKKIVSVISPEDCNYSYDTLTMFKDTLLLSETEISPINNWAELKRDFVEIDLEGTPQKEIVIEGIKQYEGPYIPQKPSLIHNPASYLYSRYNKLGRINHKLEKIRKKRFNNFSN